MNDRDRLIELIKYCADCPHPEEDFPCECCRYAKEKNCREAYIADHLIANGVTIREHGRQFAYRCPECNSRVTDFSKREKPRLIPCPRCGTWMNVEDNHD